MLTFNTTGSKHGLEGDGFNTGESKQPKIVFGNYSTLPSRVPNIDAGEWSMGIDMGIAMGIDMGIAMGIDMGIDVGIDMGIDVGIDMGIAMGIDMGIDVGIDMGIDMGFDMGIDVGIDMGINMGINMFKNVSFPYQMLVFRIIVTYVSRYLQTQQF